MDIFLFLFQKLICCFYIISADALRPFIINSSSDDQSFVSLEYNQPKSIFCDAKGSPVPQFEWFQVTSIANLQ